MSKRYFYSVNEFLFIFIALPLLFFFRYIPITLIVPTLWVLSFYVLFILKDDISSFAFDRIEYDELKEVFKRFIIIAFLLSIFTYIFFEERLFSFIEKKPYTYILIMFLYPILSVIPQELIFRKFFLFRYKQIFMPQALILLNALVFGFIHIIFANYIAVIFSFVGGIIFMRTYLNSKSFTLVCIEHALYGDFIFTIGLGDFFYHGAVH
ncbi:CPBP family intramembrane glutamic endopeptidase [Halarcobacter ebronensis]|uniref:CPBP family intramembrane metalloprotease n=1 Tax=Halarcobacter ebronensis TaxID=1462615 RepID=A0A4Q1AKU2_9BACT|nr:CPBP family intramembrane glutamic endopeptidase [Halarcobacter ebronensis]QKF81430.1 putative membrane protein [Halarcobacter ebronensis]RXK02507.1 CPBP family intramembrane metalloprotease [Halarcobacter ebronensis]